jgi:hypothetical protein
MQICGRWNDTISPDYSSAMFWMSNISLMLSPTKLTHENLEYFFLGGGRCLSVQSYFAHG